MLDGKSDRTCCVVVALVAMAGMLSALVDDAADASTLRPIFYSHKSWQESCPPGRRVELQFGQVSLFIDPHWAFAIGAYKSGVLSNDCPTDPQRPDMTIVELSRATPKNGLPKGLRFDRLEPTARAFYEADAAKPSTRTVVVDGVAIDDITPYPLLEVGQQTARERRYRLRHLASPENPTVMQGRATCFDNATARRARNCTVQYAFNHDLAVSYLPTEAWQPDLTKRVAPADDLLTEPNDILEMDARIRAFVEELRRKP